MAAEPTLRAEVKALTPAARVHGRVLLRPAAGRAPLLVGFHGYGESAQRHLEALLPIPGVGAWHLAAVQALHPFYTREGEVVANWMTRLDRELAIADNIDYVRTAVEQLVSEVAVDGPGVFVGFSQGTAMTYRAAAALRLRVRAVIAVGGDVPPELGERPLEGFPRVLITRGCDDEWYTEEKLAADLRLLEGGGVPVEVFRYPGGHEWTDELYRHLGRFLASL